jgi:hypothetical protein
VSLLAQGERYGHAQGFGCPVGQPVLGIGGSHGSSQHVTHVGADCGGPVIRIVAAVTGTETGTLSRLHSKRRTDGVVEMTEDEHQDMLEMEREQAELGHARWAALRVRDYLAQVVEGGGMFFRGGNGFTRAATVRGQSTLEAAIELASEPSWVDAQLNTLRVKPRRMDAARAHLATMVVELIKREVGEGY